MKIALAQINPTVGDIRGNLALILAGMRKASKKRADLVVFPELALVGYPPRDLVEQPSFVDANLAALQTLASKTGSMGVLVGFVDRVQGRGGRRLANAAALLHQGKIVAIRHKTLLPTYDVFDEWRHFEPAESNTPVLFKGQRLGITICEDMWNPPAAIHPLYKRDPVAQLAKRGADILINLSSSPYHRRKTHTRLELVRRHVDHIGLPFIFVNQVGGNDELVFDGNSFAVNVEGQLLTQLSGFREDFAVIDTQMQRGSIWKSASDMQEVEDALVLGLRDYVRKSGFKQVVLGLSGGIDSAVVAVIAARALGPKNVTGILMPSEYSSRGSITDALHLAKRLGIRTHQIRITPAFKTLKASLRPVFAGKKADVTEENMQARIRGLMLMAYSNKFGALLLTTGNKSELSMGYCTLYGDMNGGLAVISDVPKTVVYELGLHMNRRHAAIPEDTFSKPPSAELRPNQTDQDSLPPYPVLDEIVEAYVEHHQDVDAIVDRGHPRELVLRILNTIDRNEYKRRQAAPGLRITPKAFGMGRRIPIARGTWRA